MSIRPRQSLLNPDLQRPSALNSIPRSSSMLWLDKNENLDPTMLAVSAEILASIPPISLATYPEAGDLYRKLSTWIGVDPEALLLTPGSDGAIRLTFETFIDNGDFVLHTNPTFAMYPIYCQMFGASVIAIEYSMVGNEPSLQVLQIVDSIKRHQPKLVCLPNPDSPTGTVISPDNLRKILSVCEEFNCVLLVDEAYHPFYKWSIVPWTKTSKNLIVARTFAKAWGAAGLRIGYAVGHPETISLLHKMRPMYEVSTIAVEFMTRMLDRVSEMENSVSRIQDGKLHFQNEMRNLGYKVLDTNGNFVHISFGEDLPLINKALAGNVLYRGSFAHPSLSGYSRFSIAPIDAMSRVIQLINQAIKERGN